jgi:hypothetical protein
MGLVIAALGGEGISGYLHQVPDWARPAPEAEPDLIIRTAMRAFPGRKQTTP